ncbi:sugar phosphate isomerase/epimerase family protein [Streptomyces sp. HC307]|uniref:sugar phosphate isomerase/epimerase family protein n=1 Tax=Streptomyces flavusporus TaxID=3385496 RepID=UPI003916FDCD
MPTEHAPPCHRLTGIGDEAAADLEGQIAAVQALGWSALELRTVNGTAMADLGPAAFRGLVDRLRDARVDVVCLASRIGNWARPVTGSFDDDLAELETLAQQCAVLRCRHVRIMSYPNDGLAEAEWARRVLDRMSRLARVAEQAGITLVHENCAGWAADRADRMLRLVEDTGSPALRLLFDTGNGVPHGYDAYELLEKVLPYVAHVHVKDAVRTGDETVYTLPGEGRARVAACLRLLRESGYSGWLSLEPHLAVRPHKGLRSHGDAPALFVRAGQRLRLLLDAPAAPVPAGDRGSGAGR